MRRAEALVAGLLHGPAELLPVSSSAHVTLVPWLLRRDDPRAAPEARKAFEVALHAGTAAGLALTLRGHVAPNPGFSALAALPAGLAGLLLERPIERRLGTPATIAAGLVAGAAAMALADARGATGRRAGDAGPRDALALGVAQAAALVPGVSRSGATLAAARARGFGRGSASVLSWQAGLPVIAGATALKAARTRGFDGAAGVGAAAAFASTLACGALLRPRPLWPYAAYRTALAGLVVRRLWQDRG